MNCNYTIIWRLNLLVWFSDILISMNTVYTEQSCKISMCLKWHVILIANSLSWDDVKEID